MPEILVIKQSDVVRALDLDELFAALEKAFVALSGGQVSVPPRIAAVVEGKGLLATMPGYVDGTLETKLVSVFAGNEGTAIPTHQGLIALFDADNGKPLALMDGTHITGARTGASTAVAVRALAPDDVRTLAVIGAGVQGGSHLAAVTRVRDFAEVRVGSRNPDNARKLAASFPGVVASESIEAAVRGADVVCVGTHAEEPVVQRDWLAPGATVTSVGFASHGSEIATEIIDEALIAVESRAAFGAFPAGAAELAGRDPSTAVELGEVISGKKPGRTSRDQLVFYKSTGHAVEDAAAARLVYERALKEGFGQTVEV